MIDGALLKRLMVGVAAFVFVSAGVALLLGFPGAFAGGLALGFCLGAFPFASWAWIATRGFATKRNRVIAALLVLAKLALYAGALYLLVARDIVSPGGVLAGLTAVVLVMTVGTLVGGAPRAKEAA
jgi:hypothetical protein